jgi:protein-tyrosine-phosphatase/DNA-binding MarR family transcriptional regulator
MTGRVKIDPAHRSRVRRSRLHAALADPTRLAIVDELSVSDRAPSELAAHLHLPGNLLAHHLDVLEHVGLIERFPSAGDRRRRYVRLDHRPLALLAPASSDAPTKVLFVCTHNSARSQLAAALWHDRIGTTASSAGTHPAEQVHPAAVAAAARVGLDLSNAVPRLLGVIDRDAQIVTVCDRAHEELEPADSWWHWSIPDPVEVATPAAFDGVVADLDARLARLASRIAA